MSWDLHNDKDTVTGKTGRGRVFQAEENSLCKGPEVGRSLVALRNSREASVPGGEYR